MTPDHKSVCSCPGVMTLGADQETCIGPVPTATPSTKKPTTAFVKVPTPTAAPKTRHYTEVRTVNPRHVSAVPTKKEKTMPTTEHGTLVPSDSAPTDVVNTRLFIGSTSKPVVVVQGQMKDESTSTVNIVVPVVCFIALFVIITIGVICFRKKRSQFDLRYANNLYRVQAPMGKLNGKLDSGERRYFKTKFSRLSVNPRSPEINRTSTL